MNRVDLDGLDGVLGGAPAKRAAAPLPVVPRATAAHRLTVVVAPPPEVLRPLSEPEWLKEPSGAVAQEPSITKRVEVIPLPRRRAITPAEPMRAQRAGADDPEATRRDLRVRRPREAPAAAPKAPTASQGPVPVVEAPRPSSAPPVLVAAKRAPAPVPPTAAEPPKPAPPRPAAAPSVVLGTVFTPHPVPFRGPRQTPPPMRAVSASRPKPKAGASRRWGRRLVAALAFSTVAFGIAALPPPSHRPAAVAKPQAPVQPAPPPEAPVPAQTEAPRAAAAVEEVRVLPAAPPAPPPSPLEEPAGLTFPAAFAFAAADPEITSRDALTAFVEEVRAVCQGRDIELVGHTCTAGNVVSNRALGKARASRVGRLLVAAGVPALRLRYASDDGAEPMAPNDSPEGRRANRRVTARCSSPTPSQER